MTWLNTSDLKDKKIDKPKAIIAIDFDDTIAESNYPGIGQPVPYAIETIKELADKGYRLILYTMRTGDPLQQAIVYCNTQYINFWGINENPEQANWAPDARKVFAHLYIDNAGMGTPLMLGQHNKPCVDWLKLRELFVAWEMLDSKEVSNVKEMQIK